MALLLIGLSSVPQQFAVLQVHLICEGAIVVFMYGRNEVFGGLRQCRSRVRATKAAMVLLAVLEYVGWDLLTR